MVRYRGGGGVPIQVKQLHETGKRQKRKTRADTDLARGVIQNEQASRRAPRREIIGSILHGKAIVKGRKKIANIRQSETRNSKRRL